MCLCYESIAVQPHTSALRYSLVIFDLDGTLADSLPWFRRHVNDVADRFSFRRISDADAIDLRRTGSREILARLEVPRWKLPAIARHMRQLKSRHLDEIPLFVGVAPMLRGLRDRGYQLALVSSDSESNARRQLGELTMLFSHFDCGASVFGKAQKFRRVVRRAGLKPSNAIAIGDEVRDIEAARAAGVACGAVTWGFGSADALTSLSPDLLFERIDDIVEALHRSAAAPDAGGGSELALLEQIARKTSLSDDEQS